MGENVEIDEVLKEDDPDARDKKYNDYVKQITPTHSCTRNVFRAFIVGGLICVLGQILSNLYEKLNVGNEDAKLYAMISLIALSVITTGLGWYSKFANYAGAGTLVPITGFANSIASAAIEFKKEGQVFGIGCQIFRIAGPVILYGIFFSWFLGVIYWLF